MLVDELHIVFRHFAVAFDTGLTEAERRLVFIPCITEDIVLGNQVESIAMRRPVHVPRHYNGKPYPGAIQAERLVEVFQIGLCAVLSVDLSVICDDLGDGTQKRFGTLWLFVFENDHFLAVITYADQIDLAAAGIFACVFYGDLIVAQRDQWEDRFLSRA